MTPLHSHCLDLDLHRLDLRFAASRLVEPHAVARLAESIERCGQIVPCIVVAVPGGEGGGAEALVLIDGYRRVAALRRLGRDTAGVEQWSCDLTQALLGVLARAQDRPFASIEQALLLRALMADQGLSQHDVARRCGRDVSWVSRRLDLLSGLPDAALAAVRGGRLSSWAANRVVVPLARANAEHAERLLAALAGTPLTTRELRRWFERYQQAPRAAREHMVSQPRLFIDTLRAREARHAGERLRDGPEGECLGDLRLLEAVIARLRKRVATLRPLPPPLIAAAPRLRAAIDALTTAPGGRTRMTPTEIRTAVQTLRARGHSLREISRLLALSRNTVRRILRSQADSAAETPPCDEATLGRLKAAFARARGNVVRVRELLADDGLDVSYSTLTRWVREADLRGPPRRVGEYNFAPGQEMQHDTSPHRVTFASAARPVTVQCAGLVLAYSRRLFIQYYPRFTRFEAKTFLLEAVRFMAGVCPVCVIDNTSVLLAAGAGADAIVAPEMAAFARTLGFRFRAHRVGNPERKGRMERPFAYVETNFLAGRGFDDFDDLNRQAVDWCRNVANHKPKQALGMSPEAAYVIERPHLVPLPEALPPVYELLERVVDLHGYVSVDTNRYSVPERYVGKSVAVYKLPAEIHVCRKDLTIAVHRRLIGERDARSTLPGHHTIPVRQGRGTAAEEALLAGHHPSLDRYAAALRQRGNAGNRRALRRLIEMKRTYPAGPFIAAIEQALRYGLFDLGRLEDLILKQVAGDFFALATREDDDA